MWVDYKQELRKFLSEEGYEELNMNFDLVNSPLRDKWYFVEPTFDINNAMEINIVLGARITFSYVAPSRLKMEEKVDEFLFILQKLAEKYIIAEKPTFEVLPDDDTVAFGEIAITFEQIC